MIRGTGLPLKLIERAPILVAKDIADAAVYALATPPSVQVKKLTTYRCNVAGTDVKQKLKKNYHIGKTELFLLNYSK